jgi:pimeloyl-ACP methyl ester carboxylesterase
MKRLAVTVLALLLLKVLLTTGIVAAFWAPDRTVADLAPRWAQPPSTFRAIDGLQVHVRDEGPRDDAAPIVLLHGTSASLHTWDGWTQQLARERRVVRVDLPGFGLTGPRPDADYRVARYVEFVVALLDSLGIEQCVLAGNSFGGWIAWETALAHPTLVRALVLVDAAGYPLESESVPIGFRIASTPLLGGLTRSVLPRGVIESSLRNTYGDPSRVTPALVDRYYELTLREGNRAALAQRFAAGRSAAEPGRIRELQLPTLILWGGKDRLIPPRYAEQFHHDIAGSQLLVFPELGHVPQEEDPTATVAAVRAFLQSTLASVAASTSPRAPNSAGRIASGG